MMSPDELLDNYEGRVVPRRFIAGFVVLSYTISLIGAGSTLELINRRTGLKGIFNKSGSPYLNTPPRSMDHC
jgi:hypothetical protein